MFWIIEELSRGGSYIYAPKMSFLSMFCFFDWTMFKIGGTYSSKVLARIYVLLVYISSFVDIGN